jgi:hypothetical protein
MSGAALPAGAFFAPVDCELLSGFGDGLDIPRLPDMV